jgi:hypothetical protein
MMEKVYLRWETKAPLYANEYRPMVERLARIKEFTRSDGSDEEQFDRGKAYGAVYELYMDAVIRGLKAESRIPFDRNKAGMKFLEISGWKHKEITRYIFMCLLAVVEWPLEQLEDLTDDQVNDKANELVYLMEEYACGGMEILGSIR